MTSLADRVLFIDAEAIVIDKPAGLAVHPGRTPGDSVEHAAADQLRFGFARAPKPVHRLDTDTSGCLLLARNPKAHKKFAQAFEAHQVRKLYLAVVDGLVEGDEGVVDLPLAKISSRAEGWRIVPDPAGKPASTRWRVLARKDQRSLLRLEPTTGRTHQLRVHAAEGLGAPIVGDAVYGRKGAHMLLHAACLIVPRAPKPDIDAEAPLPPPFAAAGFDGAWL